MSLNPFGAHGRQHVSQLSGTILPVSERQSASDDLIGTTLARVYALILSWPTDEPSAAMMVQTTCDRSVLSPNDDDATTPC